MNATPCEAETGHERADSVRAAWMFALRAADLGRDLVNNRIETAVAGEMLLIQTERLLKVIKKTEKKV